MGWFSNKKEEKKEVIARVNWKNLSDLTQLDAMLADRTGQKHVVFKHSTRCGISAMAKKQFESDWPEKAEDVIVWYLDLLNHRDISNAIAEKTKVFHKSPQAVALVNGEVVYADSHGEINAVRIFKSLEK
jgi:bacillithiol system protein YtxJ